jgi:hypothetical protein
MSENEAFAAEVERCTAEFAELLRNIATGHSSYALLIALAEHVGGALQLLTQIGQCTEEQAREVLASAERIALRPV